MAQEVPLITLLCVSRNRLSNLKRMLTSFIATVGCDFRVVVGFDEDFVSYSALPTYPNTRSMLLSPRHYYCRGANALYLWAKTNIPEFNYFVLTGDDTEFVVGNWGPALVQAYHRDLPQGGVIDLVEPDACAHFFSQRDFYDEHFDGLIWDPVYTMYNSDTDMVCRLKDMNALMHMKINITKTKQKAICIHHHNNDAMRDELAYWAYWDKYVYGLRAKKNGWPLAQALDIHKGDLGSGDSPTIGTPPSVPE